MDQHEYTWLRAVLSALPDPRQARGRRYPWELLVVVIAAAMVSGATHGRAIGQWVRERTDEPSGWLGWTGRRLPSEATLRRALQRLDLEMRLACWSEQVSGEPAAGFVGLALDGKWVRGAGRHGRDVALLGLVRHDGLVLGQSAVAPGSNEITTAPRLLAGRDLAGTVLTADALLTQRSLAAQIRDQGGHYLLAVKGNQPETQAAISALFAETHWRQPQWQHGYRRYVSSAKGHGRVEVRTLEASPILNNWLRWPEVGQVLKRTCRRTELVTGTVTEAVQYALTSLPFGTDLATIAQLWRGHWNIENKVHYVRDVTLGEDAGHAYRGSTPQALAALRNAVLNLLRLHGWSRMADAVRHYAAHPQRALALVSANSP